MPNICAHMIVAREVGKRLNINSADFIRGNLLPDIIDIENSHHKITNGIALVPDIEYHLKNLDLSQDLYIGFFVHLLLDKHYLEDYLSNLYYNKNVFLDKKIYRDYDYINYKLVRKFKLNVCDIEKILTEYNCKIIEKKLEYNIECLKQQKAGKTVYLDFESFANFLTNISDIISKELVDYANKNSKLYIRLRK